MFDTVRPASSNDWSDSFHSQLPLLQASLILSSPRRNKYSLPARFFDISTFILQVRLTISVSAGGVTVRPLSSLNSRANHALLTILIVMLMPLQCKFNYSKPLITFRCLS